jgi:hypothetical protein
MPIYPTDCQKSQNKKVICIDKSKKEREREGHQQHKNQSIIQEKKNLIVCIIEEKKEIGK